MWKRRILLVQRIGNLQCRSTSKIAIEIPTDIQQKLENDELKPRHHPGRNKPGNITLPTYIIKGITRAIGDYPVKTLHRDAEIINKQLLNRHPPPEEAEVQHKLARIQEELKKDLDNSKNTNTTNSSELEDEKFLKKQSKKIQKRMKERLYAWRPITYGHYESMLYALVRGSMEYTILMQIFMEIIKRDQNFKPRSYFDFGSGVGTGMWAASNFWKNTIYEYFNVDSSRDMNELSDLILREGYENKQSMLRNVFYRQFLPTSDTQYNLIISAFTLLDLPNAKTRKDVILNLWNKCDGYLIIVEQGSRAGFELINEARQNILRQRDPKLRGHVFSPCPHDFTCPRKSNANDRTPCNFEVHYETMPIGQLSNRRSAVYSYVVIKKGLRNIKDDTNNWPRIVRETLVRTKHTVCRLCTSEGKLQEIIFTASKHGKLAYRCARTSRWGDRLPIVVKEETKSDKTNSRLENIKDPDSESIHFEDKREGSSSTKE